MKHCLHYEEYSFEILKIVLYTSYQKQNFSIKIFVGIDGFEGKIYVLYIDEIILKP